MTITGEDIIIFLLLVIAGPTLVAFLWPVAVIALVGAAAYFAVKAMVKWLRWFQAMCAKGGYIRQALCFTAAIVTTAVVFGTIAMLAG